jgi:hypothetical protein
MELINSLNTEFGISDDVNSARLHIFQFMEDTHDVTTFNTFTKGELISDVLRMDYHQYHGKATNVRKAVQYGAKILQVSLNFKGVKMGNLTPRWARFSHSNQVDDWTPFYVK